jgi:hypothetical protein
VGLDRAKCSQAARFNLEPDEAWEVDFLQMPLFRTEDKPARLMFLLAAVDAKTGARRVWQKLTVDPATPRNGTMEVLKPLWESLAAHLLEGVIRYGKVPGTLNMRSQRIMRFLRPLGLQLPFKMVIHKQLPQIAAVVNRAILEHTV